MAKHRMEPRFEEGRFIPAFPHRIGQDKLNFIEQLKLIRTASDNPLASLSKRGFRDPTIQTTFMGMRLTQTSDPAMIRHCLVKNRDNYRFSNFRQGFFKPFLREGLLTAEGEKWKHDRHALAPVFTPASIARFADGMKATLDRDIADFVPESGDVELLEITTSLTYLILSDALFSGSISRARGEVLSLVGDVLASLGKPHLLDLLGMPASLPRLGRGKGMATIRKLRALIRTVAEQRMGERDRGDTLPEDFLTLMIGDEAGFDLDTIEDQMVTFIGAGHETTAQALSWMFYLLANDTRSRARAEAEIDGLDMTRPPVEWADALPWTMACFRESLRLFPPAAAISRQANGPDAFAGFKIEKDEVFMVQLFALHRHQTLWEQPDAFMPERFFGEARGAIDRFQYLPFGVGHRVCIGERFAMVEAGILIASLMRRFRFDYAGDKAPWPTIRLSLQPEQGMKMRVAARI